ncbi:hypothetical protein QOT17_016892 [Balamuthia mandrillaris]
MSGEVLPPVIFTNCPTVPKDVDVGGDGKVVYIPGLSVPSADLTLRWMGPRPSRAYVRWLLEEGYRPGKCGARLYEEMTTAYLGWKHNLRLVASNAEQHRQCSARNQTWHVWQ